MKLIKFSITKVILFFSISFLFSNVVLALTQNQMLIINQVLNAEQGRITKQMHSDFWRDIPNKQNFTEFMETSGLMAKVTRDSMNYQMELWKSALISYQNKQIFKSDDYVKSRELMNDFLNRLSKNIPDINERQAVKNQMAVSMANSDELLRAAASRTNFNSVQGQSVELSEERLKFIINNIEKSFIRIDKLLKPDWSE